MFSFPLSQHTHSQSHMNIPTLKGLLGYQQPPFLEVQDVHIPPREDMSI